MGVSISAFGYNIYVERNDMSSPKLGDDYLDCTGLAPSVCEGTNDYNACMRSHVNLCRSVHTNKR